MYVYNNTIRVSSGLRFPDTYSTAAARSSRHARYRRYGARRGRGGGGEVRVIFLRPMADETFSPPNPARRRRAASRRSRGRATRVRSIELLFYNNNSSCQNNFSASDSASCSGLAIKRRDATDEPDTRVE